MARLGLILGSGAAGIASVSEVVAIDRHGDPYVLPHLVDHERNVRRLLDGGCDRIIGIASVGGLRPELGPGIYVCPDDFIALDVPPRTALDGVRAHRVPGFDPEWRAQVLEAFGGAVGVRDGGVYWQVAGPRLETRAEVRFIAAHADVVGMTIASECVAAGELGVPYAAICLVDNFANGVAATELTLEDVTKSQLAHRPGLAQVLAEALPALA